MEFEGYDEHLEILMKGVSTWNAWREKNRDTPPNLKALTLPSGINLSDIDLHDADLRDARLAGINLSGASLEGARLSGTNFNGSILFNANLARVDLYKASFLRSNLSKVRLEYANLSKVEMEGADLSYSNLSHSILKKANLSRSNFLGAKFTNAVLGNSIFENVNLSKAIELETCKHLGPSLLDHRTLTITDALPIEFLRGVGLPDNFIDNIPSLFGTNVDDQYYSCFISYSSKDEDLAKRLYSELQDNGVRCWFAPEDLRIGDKIRHSIDKEIRIREKLLIILSENSINSEWVKTEVETAFEVESERSETVLFPIRVDEAVMETKEAWARMLRRERHIGEFTNWIEDDIYSRAFNRLLRDLKRGK